MRIHVEFSESAFTPVKITGGKGVISFVKNDDPFEKNKGGGTFGFQILPGDPSDLQGKARMLAKRAACLKDSNMDTKECYLQTQMPAGIMLKTTIGNLYIGAYPTTDLYANDSVFRFKKNLSKQTLAVLGDGISARCRDDADKGALSGTDGAW